MSETLSKQLPKRTPNVTRMLHKGCSTHKPFSVKVVNHYVHGSRSASASKSFTLPNLIKWIQAGLHVWELNDLQASLNVPAERLAPMLGISKATFHRRKVAGARLGSAVSDRVVRYAQLMGRAIKAFGDKEDARQWLNSPQFGLGNAVPLDYAKTEVGAREVENLLGRIEYGVYS